MENASNALLMAGIVLIGILIISAGVFLFAEFSATSSQISNQLNATQISQFNSQFTKFEGREDITAHQIVSICNLAKKNNQEYYGNNETGPYYITIKLKESGPSYNRNNLEKEEESFFQDFIKHNDVRIVTTESTVSTKKITFKCTEVTFNSDTKLVNGIFFAKNLS